jgi:hypothetical protein
MNTLQIKITALAVLAVLAFPAAAFAASSNEGYGGPNNVVSGIEDTGDDSTPPAGDVAADTAEGVEPQESSTLPFTGADIGILVAVGALLLAFGFGLRRLTHSPSQP